MAIASTNTIATGGIGRRIENIWAQIVSARKARADYVRTLNELSALSNRELDDLGISRHDIPRIAREAAELEG